MAPSWNVTLMQSDDIKRTFGTAVPDHFSEVAARYGCTLSAVSSTVFRMQSTSCDVKIRLSDAHQPDIIVTIAPRSEEWDAEAIQSNEFGLGVVISCLFKRDAPRPKKLRTGDDVRRETQRLAHLLDIYGGRSLRGDFSEWPRLRACVDARVKARSASRGAASD